MKYLKLFENHNELYTEISADEYEVGIGYNYVVDEWDIDFIKENWIDFTEKELDSIKDLEDEFYISINFQKDLIKNLPQLNSYIRVIIPNLHFYINKIKDEWYYVTDSNKYYYKCDQFDGLLSCIKKEILK